MYFAHKKGDLKETLEEHSSKTLSYLQPLHKNQYIKILKEIGYSDNILEYSIFLLEQTILNHDIGKKNHMFQTNKMKNSLTYILGNSNHSLKGSVYLFSEFKQNISNLNISLSDKKDLKEISILLTYIVARHHSHLNNLSDYLQSLMLFKTEEFPQMEEISDNDYSIYLIDEYIHELTKIIPLQTLPKYALLRYVRGVLSNCDHYATSEFYNGLPTHFDRITSNDVVSINKKKNLKTKSIHYDNSEINSLRNAFVSEMYSNISSDKLIDYIDAPTGSGKTNLSLEYVMYHLEQGNKIIYSTQYNNVSEQTYSLFSSILDTGKEFRVALNNSINEIYHIEGEDIYDESYFRYQNLEYHFSLISNQKLLNTFFGSSLDSAKAFSNIHNSIIVIDELQDMDISIWKPLVEMLDLLVRVFDCRVLLMSATLPRITNLLNIESNELIRNQSLITNPIFRDRVEIKSDLYSSQFNNSNDIYNDLYLKMKEYSGKRQLVEFISKKEANTFYNGIKEEFENVYLITGDTSSIERKDIIQEISEKNQNGDYIHNDFILVATQVIEAGLDIDCEIGYKDVSTYPSELQFLGRINRNNKYEKGFVYLFNKTNSEWIYDQYRTLKISNDYINDIVNYNYGLYFNTIMDIINREPNYLENTLKKGCYLDLANKVRINNNTIQVYILDGVYKEHNATSIYNTYCSMRDSVMSYSMKAIELSKIRKELSYFTKNIYFNDKVKTKLNIFNHPNKIITITQKEFDELVSE